MAYSTEYDIILSQTDFAATEDVVTELSRLGLVDESTVEANPERTGELRMRNELIRPSRDRSVVVTDYRGVDDPELYPVGTEFMVTLFVHGDDDDLMRKASATVGTFFSDKAAVVVRYNGDFELASNDGPNTPLYHHDGEIPFVDDQGYGLE